MKTCQPQGLCSWDFYVHGFGGSTAELTFNWFTEQGEIRHPGENFQVVKHGVASGRWTLEQAGEVIAEAHKPSALFREFELKADGLHLTLKAVTPVTRSFEILRHGEILGRIEPRHPFTRRAVLTCDSRVPDAIQWFAFWLVVITWRRAANSAN